MDGSGLGLLAAPILARDAVGPSTPTVRKQSGNNSTGFQGVAEELDSKCSSVSIKIMEIPA
jgi:hypothetical protein